MGLRFRKSVNFGPFRVNFSKSGVGYSVGGKGARITKKAKGGFRATASVPGTGVSYTKDFGGKKSNAKKQAAVPATETDFSYFQSDNGTNDNSGNPLELAPDTNNYPANPQPPQKPKKHILAWIFTVFLILCFFVYLPSFASVLFLLTVFLVTPPLANFRQRFNLKSSISCLVAAFTFFAGVMLAPVNDTPVDEATAQIEQTEPQTEEQPKSELEEPEQPKEPAAEQPKSEPEKETPAAEQPKEESKEPAAAEPEKAEPTKNNTVVAVAPIVQQPKEQPKTEQPTTTPKTEQAAPAAAEQPKEQPKAEQPITTPKTEQAVPAAAEQPKEQPKAEQPTTTPKTEQAALAAAPAENKEAEYVLNTSTKKFHSPGCADVKRISAENYGICNSREEAVSMGYKPCGHCKP